MRKKALFLLKIAKSPPSAGGFAPRPTSHRPQTPYWEILVTSLVHLRTTLLHLHFPEQDLRQPQCNRVEHAVDVSFSIVFALRLYN